MKVTESFAVEATEEVRKDPRFEWYVNWLKSLDKDHMIGDGELYFGVSVNLTPISYYHYFQSAFKEILTLDEVYSRYGKEIYEANGMEQHNEVKSSKLRNEYTSQDMINYAWFVVESMGQFTSHQDANSSGKILEIFLLKNGIEQPKEEQPFQGSREYDEKLLIEYIDYINNVGLSTNKFLNDRYQNESILKQIAEHKAKIEELEKQLR